MPQQPSARGLIFRNGFIFGGIIAAIALVNVFINWSLGSYSAALTPTGDPTARLFGASTFISCAVFLVDIALMFVAGMLTARKTGAVGAASLTGLVAGVIGALVGSAISITLLFTVIAPSIQAPADSGITQSQMQSILVGAGIFSAVFGILLDGGFGAGMGALGGLVGRNTYQQANPPQPYQGSFYPGAAGGYPGAYPNQPQYPAPPPFAAPPAPGQQPPMTPPQYPQYPPQNPPQQG